MFDFGTVVFSKWLLDMEMAVELNLGHEECCVMCSKL